MTTTKTKHTLYYNDTIFKKIQIIAEQQNRTATNYIETVLKEKIEEHEAEHGKILITNDNKE